MLGKLTKYELRATARNFLPLYIVILAFAGTSRVLFQIDLHNSVINTISNLMMIGYISMLVATFVVTVVVLVQRFYKNLLCDEGYLMHTLPVKSWQNITAKLIASILWMLATLCVVFLSILIMVADTHFFQQCIQVFQYVFRNLFTESGLNFASIFVEGIFGVFTQMIATILMVYVSLAIGNLFQKNRVGASFIAYICIYFALNMLMSLGLLLANTTPIQNVIASLSGQDLIHCVFLGAIFINLLLSVVYFIVTNYILSRRLNLQ